MKEYQIRFSIKGFVTFLLIMIPNIVWMIYPPVNDVLSTNSSRIAIVDIIMSVSQWIMIAMLILIQKVKIESRRIDNIYIAACTLCIAIYYISWICYYFGIISSLMLLGMAVFPCCFFVLNDIITANIKTKIRIKYIILILLPLFIYIIHIFIIQN